MILISSQPVDGVLRHIIVPRTKDFLPMSRIKEAMPLTSQREVGKFSAQFCMKVHNSGLCRYLNLLAIFA